MNKLSAAVAALFLGSTALAGAATPWPLGVFSPVTSYSGGYSSEQGFEKLMGVSFVPIQNFYTDFTQSPGANGSNWLGSSDYNMGGFDNAATNGGPNNATNPWLASSGVIPMGDIPMVSTAAGAPSQEQILQNYINGTYDSMLQGMYSGWFAAGYHTQYWRPGVEMNEYSTSNSCGTDSTCLGLWRGAFQHIYTVMHAEAATLGGTVQIVWNPGADAGGLINPLAANSYWPGIPYVDVLGMDLYDNAYPNGSNNPCPNYANVGANLTCDSQGGASSNALGLLQAIAFAKANNIPVGFPETGMSDDNPLFPAWLAGILRSTGVKVAFVDLWDSNGGCQCEFTDGSKPNGAAAWAANFGAAAQAITPPVVTPPVVTPPAHAASPAGTQINGATGSIYDSNGAAWTITSGQQLAKNGAVEPTSADVVAAFWDGANLDQLNTSGAWWTQPLTGGAGVATTQPAGYKVPVVAPTIVSTTALPQSSFTVYLSADEYQGNAQAQITVDGKVVATGLAVTALHGSNQEQAFTWLGSYGAGSHTVAVKFLNDDYGGSTTTDRNLYFMGLTVDGTAYTSTTSELPSTGNSVSVAVTTVH